MLHRESGGDGCLIWSREIMFLKTYWLFIVFHINYLATLITWSSCKQLQYVSPCILIKTIVIWYHCSLYDSIFLCVAKYYWQANCVGHIQLCSRYKSYCIGQLVTILIMALLKLNAIVYHYFDMNITNASYILKVNCV